MSLLRSILTRLGLIRQTDWPKKHRASLDAAWVYAQHVTRLAGDRPRIKLVPSTAVIRGQHVALSPTGNMARGWYVPASHCVCVVAGAGITEAAVQATAAHEFGHHLCWTRLGTMEHVPQFRQFFVGWEGDQ